MAVNELKFLKFDESYVKDLVDLWNRDVYGTEIYADFSEEDFKARFLSNPNYNPDGSIMVLDGKTLVGFGSAIYFKESDPKTSPGFITCLVVKTEYRRQGIGTKILLMLEEYIKASGRNAIRNYFGGPINLKWYVPGYDRHEHAGAPAVPFNSKYYFLLLANGYNVAGQHDAFHVDLCKFTMPQPVLDKIAENEADGFTITFYDKNIHYGFDAMFDELENEGFRRAVNSIISKPDHDPLLIVQNNGEILGFTGPVRTEPSGRAFLAGVAVHPKVQKRGLGKTMFCELCRKSKENGATFMTLFTGSDNRARNIYLYAGLKIVQSFVVMKKEFN